MQNWWRHTASDLHIRRGQAGRRLLELAGDPGASPYRLCLGLERIRSALRSWAEQGGPPDWAGKLSRQIEERLEVLKLVSPTAEELME